MATRTGRRTKAGRRVKKAARGGAAAFAVGLFLAGPQAVAGADTGSEGSAATEAGQASSAAQAPARAGVTRSKAAGARTGSPAAEGAGRGAVGRGSAPGRTVAPAAGVRAPRAAAAVQGPHAAAAEQLGRIARTGPNGAAVTVPVVPVPSTPVVSTLARSAAVVGAAVVGSGPVSAAAAAAPSARWARSVPAASAVALPSPADVQDMIDGGVRAAFNAAEHWLFGLSDSPLKGAVEGALLMLRRSFFNHAPRLTPSQHSTSETGIIQGRLGAFDLEGDTLTYTVVDNPQHGTVVVSANGSYSYTKGEDFGGTDSFTVRIAPAKRSLNVLNLGSDGSRVATIQIGAENFVDAPDVAVHLPDASGHLEVKKNLFNQFTGTVSLSSITPDTVMQWMGFDGRRGSVTVEKVATEYWPDFKAKAADNGATVNLTIGYTDASGAKNAVLLDNVDITKKGDEYVFTGRLAANPELDPRDVDRWDVVGKHLKAPYENFLTTYNIGTGGKSRFTTVSIDFTGASVYADTLTPLTYRKAGGYAQDSEARQEPTTATPGSSDPAPPLLLGSTSASTTSSSSAQTAVSTNRPVTASAAFGQSVLIGRDDGSVESWTDGQLEVLKDGGWKSAVNRILVDYSLPYTDEQGKPYPSTFTGYIRGTTLTVTSTGVASTVVVGSEITGAGIAPGTVITKFVPQTASCTATSGATCTTISGTGAGGLDGSAGTYEVSIAQTVGSQTTTLVDPDDPTGALKPAGIAITQKNVSAGIPSLIVGLADGAVELYSATTGWVELHDSGWGASVTSMIRYGQGIAVGLDNGSVQLWNPLRADGTAIQDPARWKDNWNQLAGDGWRQPVAAMVPYKAGFLVGLGADKSNPGGVQYWDGSGWNEVHDTGWGSGVSKMIAYKDGVVVGLADGRVEQWTGTARPSQLSTLASGAALSPGGVLTSPNGVYTLRLQSDDGNLVLYGGGKALWNTQSAGKGANKLIMQSDGNLVLYNYSGSPVWAANTNGKGAVTMSVNDDGNVVLYKADGTAVWASQTSDQHGASGKYKEPNPRPSPFANNWTQLSTGWKSEVTALMPYKGQPQICSGGCDGFLVGLADGAVFQFNDARNGANLPGWYNLQGTGWASGVTTLVPFDRDAYGLPLFMVGLDNGGVQKWDGSKFIEVHGSVNDARIRYRYSAVTAMIAVQNSTTTSNNDAVIADNVYVGLSNGDIKEWTNTAQRPSDKDSLGENAYLGAGIAGAQGNALTSPNGSYSLFLQDDGNVVLYGGGDALWSTKTEGTGGNKLLMQDDGNLVLYKYDQENDTSTVVWSTDTAGKNPLPDKVWNQYAPGNTDPEFSYLVQLPRSSTMSLAVQDDGNVVLYKTYKPGFYGADTPLPQWASGFGSVANGGVNGASGNYSKPTTTPDPISNNWMTLSSVGNVAAEIMSRKEALTCGQWKCYNPGAVNDANLFGMTLAGTGLSLPSWGDSGGVGSSADPIFGDPRMAAGSTVAGSYLPFAYRLAKNILGDQVDSSLNSPTTFIGSIDGDNLTVDGVKPPALAKGMALSCEAVVCYVGGGGSEVAAGTTIVDGAGFNWKVNIAQQVPLTKLSASQTPNVKYGLDVNPTVYGYVYYPDGFLPKFHPGNYSLGAFISVSAGPGAYLNLAKPGTISVPIKIPKFINEIEPGFITDGIDVPVDYIGFKVGANASVDVTLTPVSNKPSVGVHAWGVVGTLTTYNSKAAPGRLQVAANTGFDVSANDVYKIIDDFGDFSLGLNITPYLNISYKIGTPADSSTTASGWAKWFSGWNLFEINGGLEVPLSATHCISMSSKSCPSTTRTENTGFDASGNNIAKFIGVVNNGSWDKNTLGRVYPAVAKGNVLTVTNASLVGNALTGEDAVGFIVQGAGLPIGTTITGYLGRKCIVTDACEKDTSYSEQYTISVPTVSVGGGYYGTFPTITVWKPGGRAATILDAALNLTYSVGVLPGVTSFLTKKGILPVLDFTGFFDLDAAN